jgi:predicted PurR-regulated permease PerM
MDTPHAAGWASRERLHVVELTAASACGAYLCYRMALPFVPALTWALTLAVLVLPAHRRLEAATARPHLAALLSVLLTGLLLVVPVALVGQRLVGETIKGADAVNGAVTSGAWTRAFDGYPSLARVVRQFAGQNDLPGAVTAVTTWATGVVGSVVRGSLTQALDALLTFYLLCYLLRDRRLALQTLRNLSPLADADMDTLFARVSDTIHATVYGTLTVAAVQGTLGGLMFWWLDLPAPVLWGLIMAGLAVVPVLGAFVVWIPAALLLLLQGSLIPALVLTAWGGIVVAGIDNVIYPVLVGNRMHLHTIPAFMAIVGGLSVFGPSGLLLGPVTLIVTLLLLDIWRRRAARVDPMVALRG